MKKYLFPVFWALVISFLFILGVFFIPFVNEMFMGPIFLLPIIIFAVLGIVLTILTILTKIKKKLKIFLLFSGISSAGFFIGTVLHNLIFALFIYLFGENFWERTGIGDEPFFFLFATILCPIGFLIGTIGTITILIKDKIKK